jgi:4-hydroxy-tetrahydrodipicolinate reductase
VKIIISGYGKMGKEIEIAALARGHQVLAKLDTPDDWSLQKSLINLADIAIDFSTPDSAVNNIRRCFDQNLPVVVGTTGWHENADLVKKWCVDEQQSVFIASNFSIGINILYSLTEKLSKFVDEFEDYEISLEEIHHIHKLDKPSGTAIRLANIILGGVRRKKSWVNRRQSVPEELEIISGREDEIPGIHTITCESESDRLVLRHEAKGRKGFAVGAMLAAEWLIGKKGFFEMKDLLNLTE